MDQKSVIETHELTKIYLNHTVVNNLSFSVKEGEIFGFLGPNGSGKTTTLLMLIGLTEPTKGWARVADYDPTREAIKVKRTVGYVPENIGFYSDMDAKENLQFLARLNNIPDSVSSKKIEEALENVGLKDDANKITGVYSRGMRQRLAIAEILIKEPKIVFLDEPTLGLDPDGTSRIIQHIQSLSREKNITVLLSSHDLKQVQKISDRIGIMINGKMIALGTIEQLAKEKLGIGNKEISLDDVYMKYFQEV